MSGFATAADLAERIGVSDLPPRAQGLIDEASALVRVVAGQRLSLGETTDLVIPETDEWTFILPERPVNAISALTVNGDAYADYSFTRAGVVSDLAEKPWSYGAVVTYSHGWASTTDEHRAIRSVVLNIAARALTMNERSASEALGNVVMESSGYSPEIFLTDQERWLIRELGFPGVG